MSQTWQRVVARVMMDGKGQGKKGKSSKGKNDDGKGKVASGKHAKHFDGVAITVGNGDAWMRDFTSNPQVWQRQKCRQS